MTRRMRKNSVNADSPDVSPQKTERLCIPTRFSFSFSLERRDAYSFPPMNVQQRNIRMRHNAPCRLAAAGLGIVWFVLTATALFAADDKITGRLIVEDVLARPGAAAVLKARLVQDGLLGLTGLGGETITFTVQGQRVGTVLTGGDGRAFLEFKTHMRGNQTIVAEVESSPRVHSVKGVANFASWERRRPILLVDVATLLKSDGADSVALPALPFFNPVRLGEPDDDAPRELAKLGEFYYNIIYLVRGTTGNVDDVRDWLRTAQFPPGITRVIPPGSDTLLEFIERLKEGGWDHVEAGIGRTKGFADTLVKNRIKAVIFPDSSKKEKFPRRAKIVSTWKEVRKHL